jgi:hypothetical protein
MQKPRREINQKATFLISAGKWKIGAAAREAKFPSIWMGSKGN